MSYGLGYDTLRLRALRMVAGKLLHDGLTSGRLFAPEYEKLLDDTVRNCQSWRRRCGCLGDVRCAKVIPMWGVRSWVIRVVDGDALHQRVAVVIV